MAATVADCFSFLSCSPSFPCQLLQKLSIEKRFHDFAICCTGFSALMKNVKTLLHAEMVVCHWGKSDDEGLNQLSGISTC